MPNLKQSNATTCKERKYIKQRVLDKECDASLLHRAIDAEQVAEFAAAKAGQILGGLLVKSFIDHLALLLLQILVTTPVSIKTAVSLGWKEPTTIRSSTVFSISTR